MYQYEKMDKSRNFYSYSKRVRKMMYFPRSFYIEISIATQPKNRFCALAFSK